MLSIIVPTLNEEKNLPFLLNSIKFQNFNDYEVIIADAGSKDKTLAIAKKNNCKVVPGGLPAKGRNEGAKKAKGEFLLFLDADVILADKFFEKTLKEVKRRNLDIASFPLIPRTRNVFIKLAADFFYNWPVFIYQKILAHGAMGILVRRDIFKKVGGFREDIKLAEDHYFTRMGAKLGKFGVIRSAEIFISLRRFEKDGYVMTSIKYILCGIYMIIVGPATSDIFNYQFDHYSKKKKEALQHVQDK